MSNYQKKIFYVTPEQYETLKNGGTVGSYTGIDLNATYFVRSVPNSYELAWNINGNQLNLLENGVITGDPVTIGYATYAASAGNAVTLDEQPGSFYLDYNNFTNTPSLMSAAEGQAGTETLSRLINASNLKSIILYHLPKLSITTTGTGNAITSISEFDHAITVTKGSTFSLDGHNHDDRYYTEAETNNLLANKVDKVTGKQLSTEDFTTILKNKLDGIAAGAEVNVQADWNVTDINSDAFIKNKPTSMTPTAHTLDSHTGTLSINKGGTGATTASAALAALGGEPIFSKNTAFNKNFGSTAGTVAEGNHKYHSFNHGQYFFDNYDQGNYFRLFTEIASFDQFRFQPVSSVEYFDGSSWVGWTGGDAYIKLLLDGREDTGFALDHTHRRFRFIVQRSGAWPIMALLVLQETWTGLNHPNTTIKIETWNGSAWVLKDTTVFGAGTTGNNLGIHVKATNTVHDGIANTRVSIEMDDWTDSGSYTTIPLRRLMFLSNFNGGLIHPWSWDYNKTVTFPATVNATTFVGTLTGTASGNLIPTSTYNLGTTAITFNRASAAQALTGISIDGSAGSLKSTATTGLITITGPTAGQTRSKTVRDAADTILELGGSYTPTGNWNWTSATGTTWPTFNQNTTGSALKLNVTDVRTLEDLDIYYELLPNQVTDKSVTSHFGYLLNAGTDWRGILTVKGWTADYAAWQLIGVAHTTADDDLYFRSGAGTTWRPPVKIWHGGNLTNLNQLTNGPGYITGNQSITLSGDVAGTGSTAITTALTNSGVTAGSYAAATVTVDAKGRVTSASSNTIHDLTGTANQITVTGAGKVLGAATTLSLPQNIHTGANPTFAGVTLGAGSETWSINDTSNTLSFKIGGSAKATLTNTGVLTADTFVGSLTGTASGNLTSSSTLDASKLSGAISTSVTQSNWDATFATVADIMNGDVAVGEAMYAETAGVANNIDSTNTNTGYTGAYSMWIGTQAQYDAIGTKSSTTIYYVI